jgi:hypothetical protein
MRPLPTGTRSGYAGHRPGGGGVGMTLRSWTARCVAAVDAPPRPRPMAVQHRRTARCTSLACLVHIKRCVQPARAVRRPPRRREASREGASWPRPSRAMAVRDAMARRASWPTSSWRQAVGKALGLVDAPTSRQARSTSSTSSTATATPGRRSRPRHPSAMTPRLADLGRAPARLPRPRRSGGRQPHRRTAATPSRPGPRPSSAQVRWRSAGAPGHYFATNLLERVDVGIIAAWLRHDTTQAYYRDVPPPIGSTPPRRTPRRCRAGKCAKCAGHPQGPDQGKWKWRMHVPLPCFGVRGRLLSRVAYQQSSMSGCYSDVCTGAHPTAPDCTQVQRKVAQSRLKIRDGRTRTGTTDAGEGSRPEPRAVNAGEVPVRITRFLG